MTVKYKKHKCVKCKKKGRWHHGKCGDCRNNDRYKKPKEIGFKKMSIKNKKRNKVEIWSNPKDKIIL